MQRLAPQRNQVRRVLVEKLLEIQGVEVWGQNANSVVFNGLLCKRNMRPRDQRPNEKGDELAPS
jgi:hypothetical protein